MKIADIGDILLFRGKRFAQKITRKVTASKFGKTILRNLIIFNRSHCDGIEV